ncbi:hypothetical protein DVK01_01610 [Haloarcula sp. Atlit-120R]|nr:hypothetical protein DVK01_01610 [Haloarcula sp. Atlit-120R]
MVADSKRRKPSSVGQFLRAFDEVLSKLFPLTLILLGLFLLLRQTREYATVFLLLALVGAIIWAVADS